MVANCIPFCVCNAYYAGISSSDKTFIVSAAILIVLYAAIRLIIEFIQLVNSCIAPYHHNFEYFLDLANWLEVPLYICAIIFASAQFSSECTCTQKWLWSVGIVAVFLVWGSLITYMRKLGILGKLSLIKLMFS